ncbi:MAG: 4-hydroxy-tetrahydrodipicolinate synthase [Alphaproteobacteria bacterium]|nr:MAG: 4-hydroxy-tetrahydrodipicolinate synthase [Alphaproteobacteria bacterium]TAF76936.1 MAG: 4-hydroxy-tetrahydrodipicolinate synthase [Alphaproteobacteria bacterium]
MTSQSIRGIFTALITPMTNEGVDYPALEALVEWQIQQGVDGLVPCGTTGESPTLTHAEHKRVVETVVKVANKRVHVMAGAGSNSTEETLDLTRHAHHVGADSVLLVAPYYNKPNAEGQFAHFHYVASRVDSPIIVYNIPGRSVIDIADDTLLRLAEACTNIVGVKDATGDLARVAKLHHRAGDRLALLSGEDLTALGFNAMGGQGCISVSSNVAPVLCRDVQHYSLEGDYELAKVAHDQLVPLHLAMFCETNPIAVKYAMSLMELCQPTLRLPLVQPSLASQQWIRSALEQLDLLEQLS